MVDTFEADQGRWYGMIANLRLDLTQDNTGNGGGALHVSVDCTTNQSLLWVGGFGPGGIWESNTLLNLSSFQAVEFDLKWDMSATMSVEHFNLGAPGTTAPVFISALRADTFGPSAPLGSFNIPPQATNSWAHITIPINPVTVGIDPSRGLWFQKWLPTGSGVAAFWLDNVRLRQICGDCLPRPRLALERAVPGLNLFAGSGASNDRQGIRTVTGGSHHSWVGAGEMEYTFSVSHATAASTNFHLYVFLVPNPSETIAPDRYDADVFCARLSAQADGSFLWKVQLKTNGMPDGSTLSAWPVLGEVEASGPTGAWSLRFLNDTNVTLASPHWAHRTFTISSETAACFDGPLALYLGVMAESQDAAGGLATFAGVEVRTNGITMLSDHFTSGLDPNRWQLAATDAHCIQTAPSNSWWLSWTTPDQGYTLATNADAANPLGWGTNHAAATILLGNRRYTLLTTNSVFTATPLDLPPNGGLFFRLQR